MIGEQANPTRMELMRLKDRIRLARKGYQLLKQKRDVLVIELMTLLHTSMTMRDSLNEQIRKSYLALNAAQSYHGAIELETIAMSVKRTQATAVGIRNAMGVKLPLINRPQKRRKLSDRGYGTAYSSAKVDEAAEGFEKTIDIVLEIAEKEVSMKRLLFEIEKTRRRVNALDYIVIPWLQESQKGITLKLEEMEKDDIIMLKSVKRYLEGNSANVMQA